MAEEVFKYVQIGGEEYRIEKFAPVPGLQLARLTLAKLTPVAEKLTGGGEEILTALCAAVSSLTDEEVEALVTKCLRFCCKKRSSAGRRAWMRRATTAWPSWRTIR